jgi:hypothetical protein
VPKTVRAVVSGTDAASWASAHFLYDERRELVGVIESGDVVDDAQIAGHVVDDRPEWPVRALELGRAEGITVGCDEAVVEYAPTIHEHVFVFKGS